MGSRIAQVLQQGSEMDRLLLFFNDAYANLGRGRQRFYFVARWCCLGEVCFGCTRVLGPLIRLARQLLTLLHLQVYVEWTVFVSVFIIFGLSVTLGAYLFGAAS